MKLKIFFGMVCATSFVLTFGFLAHYGGGQRAAPLFVPAPVLAEVPKETYVQEEKSAKLLFVGDLLFDRTVRTHIERSGGAHLFSKVMPLFASVQAVVGNLEGPITAHPSVSRASNVGEPNNTRFTFHPEAATILRDAGFTLVSLGNNHMADFGREGASSTRAYLEQAGVAYVGDPFDADNTLTWQEVHGIRIAFVGYNEFIRAAPEGTRAAIGRARLEGADFIVVLAHWGDEYTSVPPSRVRRLAGTFSAAGSDLIIGTHSHVIGETENIGKTRVFYSLGNFIFDQYWEESVRCGLVIEVTLQKTRAATHATYQEHRTHLERDGATTLSCPLLQG